MSTTVIPSACTCRSSRDHCAHCQAVEAAVKPTRPASKPYRPPHPRDAAPTAGDCLLTVQQVAAKLGVGVRTLWRMAEQNKLPQPIRFTRKLVRWHSATIQAYLDGLLQTTAATPAA